MKTALHWLITAGILGACNWMIAQKQAVVDHGTTMLLPLAPVDPRSLMQGDYMALRYAIASEVPAPADPSATSDGLIVVRVDEKSVGKYARLHGNDPLAEGEHLLKFRRREHNVRLGAESFFFQEGDAQRFEKAKYGELKVAPDGSSVLTGLRDVNLAPLGTLPIVRR